MKGAREIPTFALRLPQELKEWLKRKADENHRSLSAEILVILEESRRRDSVPI